MNKDLTLVILAAGMGSRFGGLKQIEPVDDYGNFIIDYSVYDAVKAGFNKIVFVIKEENYEVFKNTIGSRISNIVDVEYAFQKNDNLKKYAEIPADRTKPFGTAHALLCAKDYIDSNFAIISSDDFYGYGAFKQLHDAISNGDNVAIGYLLKNTMSEAGSVKRGVCFTKDGYLVENDDYKIERIGDIIKGVSLVNNREIELSENQEVSMLMYGLSYSVIEYIESILPGFFNDNKDNLTECEMLLPNILTEMINENKIKIKVVPTEEKWMGITYKDDLDKLKNYLKELRDKGVYPNSLYK